MRQYIIYRVINLITRKFYIGRTTTSLQKRWGVHKAHAKYYERYGKNGSKVGTTYFCRAMRKYGIENFEIRQIDEAKDFQHMVWLERFYIYYYQSMDRRYGYNLIIDEYGEGREFLAEESRLKSAVSSHLAHGAGGVSWDKDRQRWYMAFSFCANRVVKRFTDKSAAEQAWDRLALHAFGENAQLHHPDLKSQYLQEDLQRFWDTAFSKRVTTSRYHGVKREPSGKYDARIRNGKDRIFLGTYPSEIAAAVAYDKVAIHLGWQKEDVNLPELVSESYAEEGRVIFSNRTDPRRMIASSGHRSSRYRCVSKRSINTWEMSMTANGQRIREVYATELDASLAFDYHARVLGLDPNLLNHPDRIVHEKPVSLLVGRGQTRAQRLAALSASKS